MESVIHSRQLGCQGEVCCATRISNWGASGFPRKCFNHSAIRYSPSLLPHKKIVAVASSLLTFRLKRKKKINCRMSMVDGGSFGPVRITWLSGPGTLIAYVKNREKFIALRIYLYMWIVVLSMYIILNLHSFSSCIYDHTQLYTHWLIKTRASPYRNKHVYVHWTVPQTSHI